jgi:uncharacterized protein (TIGR03067 family)
MNVSLRRLLLFRAVLVAAAMVVQSGCWEKPSISQESAITWASPKMVEIGREWDSLWDTFAKTPEKISRDKHSTYEELVRMQGDLLRKRLSDSDLRRLAATCEALPTHWRDWSKFDRAVVAFMLDVFAHSRDRESLRTLLSVRFPLRVGNWPIEYYLAEKGRGDNSILILGEAYPKCRIPEVQHDIAAAVQRAFGGNDIAGKDDADFVANAMRWYDSNKQHLVVDIGYSDDMWPIEPEEGAPGGISYEQIWSHRKLFTTKPNVKLPASGANPSDQAKSEALGNSANGTSAQPKNGRQAEDALVGLNGTWEVIEAIDNGEPVPEAKMKGVRFVFHDETLIWSGPDGSKVDEFRVRPVRQQMPLAMDLVQTPTFAPKSEEATALVNELRDETTPAIYEVKGDILKMCIPRRGTSHRPTSFKTEKGSAETSFVLKRAKQ